jgi:DNA-binding CsgD family transcriptional regulator
MDRGLKQAQRIIAVLSPHYFKSSFTPSEWASKFVEDPKGTCGKLIPVLVQQVLLDGILSPIVYVDLVGKDETTARHELLTKLKQERAKPTRAPTFPGTQGPSFPGLNLDTDSKPPVKLKVVITGTVTENDADLIEAVVAHLRKISEDASLTLLEVRKGSVTLLLQCSRAGFERLQRMHGSGLLTTIAGLQLEKLKASDEPAEGTNPVSTILLRVVSDTLGDREPVRLVSAEGIPLLTRREEQVVSMVAKGLTNREVAVKLGLSPHTVKNHLFRIYEKLGISRRMELSVYAGASRETSRI